ncbi:hypothetical protein EDB83DRAFT_2549741 [Lactarius deliciosus]|nr:hypothetical protein EDB83DRAFT_2549741 [Lactarius deliciosus]
MPLPRFFSVIHNFTLLSCGSRKVMQLHNRRPTSRCQPPFRHPPYILSVPEQRYTDVCWLDSVRISRLRILSHTFPGSSTRASPLWIPQAETTCPVFMRLYDLLEKTWLPGTSLAPAFVISMLAFPISWTQTSCGYGQRPVVAMNHCTCIASPEHAPPQGASDVEFVFFQKAFGCGLVSRQLWADGTRHSRFATGGSPEQPEKPSLARDAPVRDTREEHLGPPTRAPVAGALGTYRTCPQGTGWCLSLYQYLSNTASLGHAVRTAMMERLVEKLKMLDAHLALRTTPRIPYFSYMSESAPNLRPSH